MESMGYQTLMQTLKDIMREKKKQYKDLAGHLHMSESSVKRIMNAKDGNFSKIDEICKWLGISLADLVSVSDHTMVKVIELNDEQDKFLAKSSAHHQLFEELMENHLSYEDIKNKHQLSDSSLYKYLRDLEKINLLEVFPGNKFRLKNQGFINWKSDGECIKVYFKERVSSFLNKALSFIGKKSDEGKKSKTLVSFFELEMSDETFESYTKELKELRERFHKVVERDGKILSKDKLIKIADFVAVGPYEFPGYKIPNV